MFYLKKMVDEALEKVAYNMDKTVYFDIYFMIDTAKVVSCSLVLMVMHSRTYACPGSVRLE